MRGPTRRRRRAGRDRVEDRVRTQVRENACVGVALAECVGVRGVIERRRDGDADGVREKSRDRDEEQNVMRIVTVRSDHEMTRVRDRHPRVSPTIYSSLILSPREALGRASCQTRTSNSDIQHVPRCPGARHASWKALGMLPGKHPRNVPISMGYCFTSS